MRMLSLMQLQAGCPALTPHRGGAMAEAAAVCLENQGHGEAVELAVRGFFAEVFKLACPPVTAQMQRAYHDLPEAVEHGSYGIAILLVRELTGLTVVLRTRKGPGFDYWLGPADFSAEPQNFLAPAARLEVSGILKGNKPLIAARVKEKLEQTKSSDGLLPAYVVVVEYSYPCAEVRRR